ncbi:MAG TPA: hypothetical protein VJ347_16790 [Streptosporangiaceae bacterium]|nr:hypothetical protein [Streptosporangiaceae bacterium]
MSQNEADLASLSCLDEMNLGLFRGAGADRLNPVLEPGPDHCIVIPAARP